MAVNNQALQAGTVLESHGGKYKIIKVIGQGGFGITYLVEGLVKVGNISMKGNFALKEHFISSMSERIGNDVRVLDSNITIAKNSLKAFIREAERLQELGIEHPNIVKVNEVFEANKTAYYVMEYLDGETLEAYVRRNGALSEADTMKFMQPIVHAIAGLHANDLAHYDIKPQNIILRKDQEDESVLCPTLIDFGLAKHYDKAGNATSTNNVAGFSEGYSPSEQYAGIKQFSPWCDVYSLAATMLFCLTGKHPLAANDIDLDEIENEISSKLSGKNCAALLKALSFRNKDRQQNADELYEGFYGEKVIAGDVYGVPQSVVGASQRTQVICDDDSGIFEEDAVEAKPWGKIIGIVIVVIIVLGTIVYILIGKDDSDTASHVEIDDVTSKEYVSKEDDKYVVETKKIDNDLAASEISDKIIEPEKPSNQEAIVSQNNLDSGVKTDITTVREESKKENPKGDMIENTQLEDEKVYTISIVDSKPQFPGGDAAMYKWLGSNISYPAQASEEGVDGRVIVQFEVAKDGSIQNARVVRGRHPALDREALRLVKLMPRWQPGRIDGHPVRVTYTLPITFKLQ